MGQHVQTVFLTLGIPDALKLTQTMHTDHAAYLDILVADFRSPLIGGGTAVGR